MTLIFWYLVLAALLTYIHTWSHKTRGNDVTLGFVIMTALLTLIVMPVAIAYIMGNLLHVLISSKYKTVFGSVIVKGENVERS